MTTLRRTRQVNRVIISHRVLHSFCMRVLRMVLKVFDYVMEESWGTLVNLCLDSPHCNSVLIQMTVVRLVKYCLCLPLHGLHGLVRRPAVIGFSIFSLNHPLVAVLILFGRQNPRSAAISGATSAEVLSRKQKFGWHGMFKPKWFKVCETELNGPDCHEILYPPVS